jgi:hypothetical protein
VTDELDHGSDYFGVVSDWYAVRILNDRCDTLFRPEGTTMPRTPAVLKFLTSVRSSRQVPPSVFFAFAYSLAMMPWLFVSTTAYAQLSYPMVMSLNPIAIQVGTTTECEVHS